MGNEMLSVNLETAAASLGLDTEDVLALIEDGSIKAKDVYGKKVISCKSLENFVNREIDEISNKSLDSSDGSRYNVNIDGWTIEYVDGGADLSMGSIMYIEASNRWIVQLDVGKTPEGKRIRKSKSFKTKEDAEDALALELAKIGRTEESVETPVELPAVPVFDAVAREFLNKGNREVEDRTWTTYQRLFDYPHRYIGSIRVDELTEEDIDEMFGYLREEYADSILKKVKTFIGMVLDYAIKLGLISENVAKKVKRIPASRKNIPGLERERALSKEELDHVLVCASKDPTVDGMIHMLAATGMRPGELRALRLEDIDLDKGTVYIRRAASLKYDFDENGNPGKRTEYLKSPKSKYSKRKLHVPKDVLEMALDQHKRMVNDVRYKGDKNSPYLFPGRDGEFLKEQALQSRWRRFRERFDLDSRVYSPYNFRHTLCTDLIRNGEDISTIQRIMGDNSTEVILKIYTHINRDDMDDAMIKLNKKRNQTA